MSGSINFANVLLEEIGRATVWAERYEMMRGDPEMRPTQVQLAADERAKARIFTQAFNMVANAELAGEHVTPRMLERAP